MNKIVSLLILFACQQSMAQNLVAHYPLNGNAIDVVGSLNGSIQGAPQTTADRFSNPNGALLFDGIDDFISVAGSPINTTSNMSLAFWMYRSTATLSAEPVLLGVDDCIGGPSLNGYSVYAGGFGPTTAFPGTGLTIAVSNVTFLGSPATVSGIGVWDFIVAQNNAGTFELYKNGVLSMSGAATMQGAPNAIRIGSATNCRFFAGAIDEVQVYDGPLNQSQITALYTSQAPLPLQFTDLEVRPCFQHACISWKTNAEQHVSHYVIQKSFDGVSFEDIGQTASRGEGINEYTFTDRTAASKTRTYYRIRSVDIDGSTQYSRTVSLTQQLSDIVCSPNPATSYIELSNAGNVLEVSCMDMTGKVLFQTAFAPRIQLPSLPKGIYLLQLKTEDGVDMRKIQVQ